jgi:hypothetical protein
MCNWRERFIPTAGAAASTVSQKIGRIEELVLECVSFPIEAVDVVGLLGRLW